MLMQEVDQPSSPVLTCQRLGHQYSTGFLSIGHLQTRCLLIK